MTSRFEIWNNVHRAMTPLAYWYTILDNDVILDIQNVTSVAFESKDDPTQMTKIVIYNYTLYYIQKTIHFKLICTNVHS